MTEKLDAYDILAVLVPGTLIVCIVPVCFPSLPTKFISPQFPEGFLVIALVALAVLLGYFVQAIASLAEPLLNWTWRGRPSENALREGLGERYLPLSTIRRVKEMLVNFANDDYDDRSLFLIAMRYAEEANNNRVARFNSLYAYHRALLILTTLSIVLFILATQWGIASAWSGNAKVATLLIAVACLVLLWYRTKQRAFYYVREVLLTAQRVIEEKTATSSFIPNSTTANE